MKLKRSAQIILVVLWVLPSAATTLAQCFSRPSVEYTLGLLPLLRLLCCIPWRICYGMRLAVCALQSSAIAGKLAPSAS